MLRALCAVVVLLVASQAFGQAFTYQGRLEDANLPVNGSYDFELVVYPVAVGGAQVGATTTALNQPITGGTFTVQVDPGAGVFDGSARWLEVRARVAGGGGYTTLTPRQPITPAPYAMRALREWLVPQGAATLAVDPAQQRLFLNRAGPVTSSEYFGFTTPTGAGVYGGMYVNTQAGTGRPFYGYAGAGSVLAWTYFDGSTLQWRVNLGGVDRLAVANDGNVGIGTATPAQRLDVVGTARATGFAYAAAQTRYLSIPPGAFQPRVDSGDAVVESSGGATYYVAAVGTGNFTAPVNLPDGAVITGVSVWLVDNSGVGDLSANLLRRPYASPGYSSLASGDTAGAQVNVQEIVCPPIGHVVNNSTDTYILSIFSGNWDGTLTMVKGARITYTVNAPD
jgi:hypothetical protein